MAILTSLFAGVSGLNAFGTGLSVISNNIANLNTTGFKDSRVSFADLVSSGSSRAQVGRGVLVNDIRTNFDQGSFEPTGSELDLAVEGEGFFVLRDAAGAEFYTRNGSFNVSKNGLVENSEGLLLQGRQATITGSVTGQPTGNIDLSTTNSTPAPTANIAVDANLDSRAVTPGAFNLATPSATSNFSTSITIYDALGNGNLVNVYFTKSSTANQWDYNAVVSAADSSTGSAVVAGTGTLVFGTNGTLTSVSSVSGTFNFSGGATLNQAVTFDFGSPTGSGGTGLDGLTQFGSSSAVLTQTQDGFAAGSLSSVSIDKNGIVTGLFTNGQSRSLAQVRLARFNNDQGLSKVGDNAYVLSNDSGQPILGDPNSGGMGRVLSNSLELSNVDLAQQFIKMIEYQRGFQANSRSITTTDELLQELVNLIR
ncbi:MAG: flagellar hook protein FlgE [Nitrospirae bacterium]|nr:flagellar hook protein FlgE [Candidatus Manganitrophaceae bacterium]